MATDEHEFKNKMFQCVFQYLRRFDLRENLSGFTYKEPTVEGNYSVCNSTIKKYFIFMHACNYMSPDLQKPGTIPPSKIFSLKYYKTIVKMHYFNYCTAGIFSRENVWQIWQIWQIVNGLPNFNLPNFNV